MNFLSKVMCMVSDSDVESEKLALNDMFFEIKNILLEEHMVCGWIVIYIMVVLRLVKHITMIH